MWFWIFNFHERHTPNSKRKRFGFFCHYDGVLTQNLGESDVDSPARNKTKSYGNWIPLLTFNGLRKLILNQSLDQKIENELFLDHSYIQRRMNLKNIILILQCNAGNSDRVDNGWIQTLFLWTLKSLDLVTSTLSSESE